MNKILLAVAVMFSVAFVPASYAKTAKEGTSIVTLSYITTPSGTVNSVGDVASSQTYEENGVLLSDDKKGPFHNLTTRLLGVWEWSKKRSTKRDLNYSIWIDQDGDKLFNEGKFVPRRDLNFLHFIGGSGKFEKMDITITKIEESNPVTVKSSESDQNFGVRKYKIEWKNL